MSEVCQGETNGLAGIAVDLSLLELLRSTSPIVLDEAVSWRLSLSLSLSPSLGIEHGIQFVYKMSRRGGMSGNIRALRGYVRIVKNIT